MAITQRFEVLIQEARYGLRRLRRSPGFTGIAIATLAIGIGANAAVFSVIDRLILRVPPGVVDAGRVRRIQQRYRQPLTNKPYARDAFSFPEIQWFGEVVPPGVVAAGYTEVQTSIGADTAELESTVTYVAGDYFGAVGVHPAIGRFFSPQEYGRADLTTLAVISHQTWIDRFDGRSDVIGKPIVVGSHRFTIIGVARDDFRGVGLRRTDVWIPFNASGDWANRDRMYDNPWDMRMRAIVRVSPGNEARARDAIDRTLRNRGPALPSSVAELASIRDLLDPLRGEKPMSVVTRLAGAALVILLIAFANVAGLFLVRAAERRRDIAIRLSMGMPRSRLAAHLMVEGFLIAFGACIVALAIGTWASVALGRILVPQTDWSVSSVGLRSVGAVALTSLLAGIGAGLVPIASLYRSGIAVSLKATVGDATWRGARVRSALLVIQTSLSVVLIAGAGLFIRSLLNIEAVWVGDRAEDVAFAAVAWNGSEWDVGFNARVSELRARLERVSSVERASLTRMLPVMGLIGAYPLMPNGDSIQTAPGVSKVRSVVSPGYLATVGIRLMRGRDFTDADRAGSPPVILVSKYMADQVWPGHDPIGQCLLVGWGKRRPCRTVVGIVDDVRSMKIIEPPSLRLYMPIAQDSEPLPMPYTLAFRAAPGRLPEALAAARRLLDAEAIPGAKWMLMPYTDVLAPELTPWRWTALLFAALGVLAVTVAGVGIYGVVSYATNQRLNEFGVRRALGGGDMHILQLAMSDGMRLVTIGVVLGVGIALALGRVAQALLYGESPHDLAVFAIAAATLLLAAFAASIAPAWRATRVDPTIALRAE